MKRIFDVVGSKALISLNWLEIYLMAEFCEHGNEVSCSINSGNSPTN